MAPRSSDWQLAADRRKGDGGRDWPSYSVVVRIFGGWREALEAAALAPAPRPARTVWTEERVEPELRAFVAGRRELPRYKDFAAAGKRGLYRALLLSGGVDRWAALLDSVARPATDAAEARRSARLARRTTSQVVGGMLRPKRTRVARHSGLRHRSYSNWIHCGADRAARVGRRDRPRADAGVRASSCAAWSARDRLVALVAAEVV